MAHARRDYKDSLFRHLFGNEKHKGNALELYNALAGTSHTDPEEVEVTTLDDFIFLGRRNDVSFLVSDELVLLEHQSTHNPNMPLRGLLYFSRVYAKIVEQRELDIYGSAPVRLPEPRFFVLYFGEANAPERETLRLSDLFATGFGSLEVTATVLNCNEGRNAAIMDACEALKGYAHLLALVRCGEDDMDLREAVESAVDQCIADGYLVEYLQTHRMEVSELLFTIADEERAMKVHLEAVERKATEAGMAKGMQQGMQQGMAKGMQQGMAKGMATGAAQATLDNLRRIVSSTGCDEESAMEMLGLTREDVDGFERLLATD